MLFSESVPAFSNYCAGNEYNNCFYVNPWEDWKTKGWCKRDLSRGVTYDPFGHCDGRGYTSENIEANFTDCEDYIVDKFGFGGERLFGQNVQLEFMSEQLVEGLTIHMLPDIDLRWSEGLSILLHFDPAMENSLLVTETPLCDQIKHYIDKKTTTLIPLSGRTGDRGLPSKLVIPVTFEPPMYLRSLTLFTASGVVPVRKVEVMTSPQKEVCMKCPRNHYCVNGAQYQCPPNSYLKRGGAFQKSECRCKQGFTRNFFLTSITCSEYDGSRGCWLSDENDDWPCIPCPEGRYCPMEPSGNSAIYDLSSECEVQCGDNEVSMCKFGPSTPCTPKSKIPPPLNATATLIIPVVLSDMIYPGDEREILTTLSETLAIDPDKVSLVYIDQPPARRRLLQAAEEDVHAQLSVSAENDVETILNALALGLSALSANNTVTVDTWAMAVAYQQQPLGGPAAEGPPDPFFDQSSPAPRRAPPGARWLLLPLTLIGAVVYQFCIDHDDMAAENISETRKETSRLRLHQ